jgi:hypothetical protein
MYFQKTGIQGTDSNHIKFSFKILKNNKKDIAKAK